MVQIIKPLQHQKKPQKQKPNIINNGDNDYNADDVEVPDVDEHITSFLLLISQRASKPR